MNAEAAWALFGLVGGVVVSYIFYRLARVQTLDWLVLTDAAIVSRPVQGTSSSLRVYWLDEQLVDPRIVVVRIVNTGSSAVRPEDFTEPVTLQHPANRIVETTILRRAKSVAADVESDALGVIQVGLMNRGTWFDVQVVSDGPGGPLEVSATFANQSRSMRLINVPKNGITGYPLRIEQTVLGLFISLFVALIVLLVLAEGTEPHDLSGAWVAAISVITYTDLGLAALALLGLLLRLRRSWTERKIRRLVH